MLAWHFVGPTLRDGRKVPKDGVTLRHRGDVIPCESGLHASKRLIDALKYAPGGTICRVRLSGVIVPYGNDKLAASERTILWRVDGNDLLRVFARRCALDVAHLWDMPDVVRQYLETGDESLRDAAWGAAWDAWGAARDAARDAAWDAWGAAWDAARDVAWAAAWDAWDAAWDAAWAARDAARDAAWDAKNKLLTAMVMAAHKRMS